MTTKPDSSHRLTFFRQSGWMMIATVLSGIFMFMVHSVAKRLPESEYSSFAVLIQIVNWMTIPALGLQMVVAQQYSAAVTDHQQRQLVGTVHAVMRWTFVIWLLMALIVFFERNQIVAALKLSNPVALLLTVVIGFLMLWLPIFQGLLQGRQNFLWLGWVQIFNGVGRALIAIAVVFLLHLWTASMMAGVCLGLSVAVGIAIWQNRDILAAQGERFDAPGWLKRVVPLTLGLGASQFLFSADGVIVKTYLDEGSAPYFFCATLVKAIPLFTGPMVAVMIPKLVHSAARSEKTNVMGLTLIGTIVFSCLAAVGLGIVGPFVIEHMAKPEFLKVLSVLPFPLFAWTMVPLGVGNVLLNNLLAHSHFKVVPALVAVAVGFWVTLLYFHDSFKMVIHVFGGFTLIFLAVCAAFTWCRPGAEKRADAVTD